MINTVEKLKALGDSNRFRIVMMLTQRSLCVCELLQVLDISGGTLSNHLKILKNSHLISQQKEGKWIVYSNDMNQSKELIQFLKNQYQGEPQFQKDLECLKSVSRNGCMR